MPQPYVTHRHAQVECLESSPSTEDSVELAAKINPVFQLITAKIKQWLTACGDIRSEDALVDAILTGMANDGLSVVILSRWQRLWVPMVQTLLGYPSERCVRPENASSPLVAIRYGLLCGFLGGSVYQFSTGVLILRQPPTSHQMLLHATHALAVQAGIDGYRPDQQAVLRRYHAWQQNGQALSELSSVDGRFLSLLQPAIAREMDALAVLQQLCNTVLADGYDQAAVNESGHA